MESSGQAVFKTVPGFAFRATFEGDIEGFRPLKVLLATTVCMATIATDLVIFGEKYGQVLANFGYLASAELLYIWRSLLWWTCSIPSFDLRVFNI